MGVGMKEKMRKFLKILSVELEDIKEDLKFMEEQQERRKNSNEITDYVYLENIGMIKKEFTGIAVAEEVLSSVSADDFQDMDELVEALIKSLATRLASADLPPSILEICKRKIAKVMRFVLD